MGWLTDRRRAHLLERRAPAAWGAILERHVPVLALLDDAERERLGRYVQIFVGEKRFEGCGGLELNDEIRVAIAGRACAMLVGHDHDLLPELESILVYPSTFVRPDAPPSVRRRGAQVETSGPRDSALDVMGTLIVAWDAVIARGGRDVVVFELARLIDYRDRAFDGMPELTGAARRAWVDAFTNAYAADRARDDAGQPSHLAKSALGSPGAYFATAVERFFAEPALLALSEPDVYGCLASYFALDLARRTVAVEPYRA